MRAESMRCELVTWGEVYRLSRRVAESIRDAGFRPDIVIAIARGGYVPARILCDFLGLYNLVSMRIAHYESGAHITPQARLSSPLSVDVRGLDVLLVDDVSDTGETLALAVEHVRTFVPTQLRLAVLHHKKVSPVVPDFFARTIATWRWLVYPWAVIEDLSSFVSGMRERPKTAREAVRQLKAQHGIDVPLRTARDVLAALQHQSQVGAAGTEWSVDR
jgi:hypoxanthine phosphoribosyltransferase